MFVRFAGILSAYGLALADVVHEAQEPCARVYDKGKLIMRKDSNNVFSFSVFQNSSFLVLEAIVSAQSCTYLTFEWSGLTVFM